MISLNPPETETHLRDTPLTGQTDLGETPDVVGREPPVVLPRSRTGQDQGPLKGREQLDPGTTSSDIINSKEHAPRDSTTESNGRSNEGT